MWVTYRCFVIVKAVQIAKVFLLPDPDYVNLVTDAWRAKPKIE